MIELTNDQKESIDIVLDWHKSKNTKFITIGGYAGTGKTTLITYIREKLKKEKVEKVAFCAYTGKAARVLEHKLKESKTVYSKDSISTIHSLIYTALHGPDGEIIGWDKKEKIDTELIIVDEASMVDENIWRDLLSYGIPIIAVGDHGQLPPISGKFNLMDAPNLTLQKIHRQAEGNPIIHLSIMARNEGKIHVGNYGKGVRKLSRYDSDTGSEVEDEFMRFDNDVLVLCGYNNTRIKLNHQIRAHRGFESRGLEVGERVICVRNNHKEGIVNGMLGNIIKLYDSGEFHHFAEIAFDFEKDHFKGDILKAQIDAPSVVRKVEGLSYKRTLNNIDRGYALTVHKSQGSQAKRVILFEERFSKMDDDQWRRWLYTAVTRAEEELLIVGT